MHFTEAVTSGFKKYIKPSGRASRSEFWYWHLFRFLVGFCTGFMEGLVAGVNGVHEPHLILTPLVSLALILPTIMVTIRRLHDVDRSGWWILIALTIIGIIPLLIWYCRKGSDGQNRFGADPLAA